jgi:CRP-like cAMP-binding protein
MIELASVPLFAGLSRDEISAILGATVKRRFEASETIIRAENPGTHLFLVRTGCVNYYIVTAEGRNVLLRRFVPGNVFGIASFLSEPMGYLGTATAVHDVEVLTWERRNVRQLSRAYPRLPENALRIALCYIAEYAERHIRLVSDTAQEKLAYALAGLASREGSMMPAGVEVGIKNADLASLADVSFFTATRVLKKWEHVGAVEKSRGKVLILSPEKMLAEETRPFDLVIKDGKGNEPLLGKYLTRSRSKQI